jgi:hypothetical protein
MVTDPVRLRTGALTAVLRDGELHEVRLGETLVLDRVHIAVRDRDWGTVPGSRHDHQVRVADDEFLITYGATHRSGDVAFRYEARIEGRDGRITFAFDGAAEREFLGNRVGFCLLHPQELAGSEVKVTTEDTTVTSAFPRRISPHQPFPEMTGMAYRVPAGTLEIAFQGELFETEDQRNWTDASYKTYCSPLRLPFPRRFTPAQHVRQSVRLTGHGTAVGRTAGPSPSDEVVLGPPNGGRLPELGFGLPSQGGPLDEEEVALIRALRPGHLRAELHADRDWRATLDRAVHDSVRVSAPLDLELACSSGDLPAMVAALAERAVVRRIHAYDAATYTTSAPIAARLRELAAEHGLEAPAGGGSRAYFAELNRADLPLRDLDFITYGISPQVHAFDDASMMDTLRAQPITLDVAAEIGAGRPVVVGPMTLLPRFNPVATGEPAAPDTAELPPEVDPRQAAPFAAAWTVGSLAALRRAHALTYYEAAGWRGLFGRRDEALAHPGFPAGPGEVFPVYTVFRELADVAGEPLYDVSAGLGVAALAVGRRDGVRMIVANLSDQARRVRVGGLDYASARLLGGGPEPDPTALELPGYGLAVIGGRPSSAHAR